MAKRRLRLLRKNEECGCESGLKYGDCCYSKKLKFHVSSDGSISRSVPIVAELEEGLQDGAARFKKMFGRKMAPRDLILFDQFLHGEEDKWQIIKQLSKAAQIREELIFAWRRSGFIVGEHSKQIMPDVEFAEWQDAVAEYFELRDAGADPFFVFTYLRPDEYEQYKLCVELIKNVIVIGFNSIRTQTKFSHRRYYYQHLMALSALNSFRTINEMFHNRYDDDCLAILRGIYEQYLRIKVLRLRPEIEERFDAAVNVFAGVYDYRKRADGTVDFTTAVDPTSGKRFRLVIPNRFIVRLSDFESDSIVYQEMYNELSGHVHHDIAAWSLRGMIEREIQLDRAQDSVRAIVLILFVSALLFVELIKSPWIKGRDKRDLRYTIAVISKQLLNLATCESVVLNTHLPNCLPDVVRRLQTDVSSG